MAERGVQDTIEKMTLDQLALFGYDTADDPCLMQTFEFSTLEVCQVSFVSEVHECIDTFFRLYPNPEVS